MEDEPRQLIRVVHPAQQLDQVLSLGVGGRPALVVNNKKFNVRNITNTLVPVMWGVEAVWAIVSPKKFNQKMFWLKN